jgi:serine/threonine-protein kinase
VVWEGVSIAPEQQLSPGRRIGAYRVVRCIGSGGMGAVYEAEHLGLQKRVALKTLYGQAASQPAHRGRFMREGKNAARIRHPHVVDITDVGEVDDVAYLVMEFLQGEPLSATIRREAPFDATRVADLLLPVIAAVAEAHRLGVVHRDLKPANIFLAESATGDAQPKVLDFGLSKALDKGDDDSLTDDNIFLGTACYVSPEQIRDAKSTDAFSDQYSLGSTAFEMATGTNPFAHASSFVETVDAVRASRFPKPSDVYPEIDPKLEDIILRAMRKDPKDRWPTLEQMGAALLEFAGPQAKLNWTTYFTTPRSSPVAAPDPTDSVECEIPDEAGLPETILEVRGVPVPRETAADTPRSLLEVAETASNETPQPSAREIARHSSLPRWVAVAFALAAVAVAGWWIGMTDRAPGSASSREAGSSSTHAAPRAPATLPIRTQASFEDDRAAPAPKAPDPPTTVSHDDATSNDAVRDSPRRGEVRKTAEPSAPPTPVLRPKQSQPHPALVPTPAPPATGSAGALVSPRRGPDLPRTDNINPWE